MNVATPPLPETAAPWLTPWPADELQFLGYCPVCQATGRSALHDDLVDNVFFVAPGRWTLHQCNQCQCAYLDPRPSEVSIGRAYGTYYTHTAAGGVRTPVSELGFLRRARRLLANGYLNRKYGTQRQPSFALGFALLNMLPRIRQGLDIEFRFLPKPYTGQTLLDVGCGSGGFLRSAAEAGWRVSGADPDPKALAVASSPDMDIRQGGIEAFAGEQARFDAITLSHVIEHVHRPAEVIQTAFDLLKPGGVLYIDTPNIQSRGAALFGKNWRGLEMPRHLVLFSQDGLSDLLKRSGFPRIEFKRRTAVRVGMALSSLRIQRGRSPYDERLARLPWWLRLWALEPRPNRQDEFLTVLAYKALQ
jgi:2-polyprenyl-3-methyl-5-hydroxy-6-metoxy-1,4-benzoquinol methylase